MSKRGRVLTREVLDEMRAGAGIMLGGSRCHTTYFFRDGSWRVEYFDEGYTEERETTEADVREVISRYPDKARRILWSARWRSFSVAFLAGGKPREALKRLAETRRFGGDRDDADILEAFLSCPPKLSPEITKTIRSEFRGFTAYHVFMGAAGWDRSAETARKGVLFVDRLIDMVGPCRGCYEVRAAFNENAGDLTGACADLRRELELSEDAKRREYLQGKLDRIGS